MKTNLIRKFKWYIVGFIMIVIMLSVGLSFCTWDDLSIKSVGASGKTGNYESMYKLVDDNYLDDSFAKGGNGIANVGDIVTFGKYYQEAPQVNGESAVLPEKTPLRWIVVHKEGALLTLLTEKVVAFGSFWGTYYYSSNNSEVLGTPNNGTYNQNYSQSTVRAWLNSEQRTDVQSDNVNAVFSTADAEIKDINPMFNGFMQEAFTADQQAYIVRKTISGMYGGKKDAGSHDVNDTYCEIYATITDKVWLPSYSEIYDNATIDWKGKSDGEQIEQFAYFKNDNAKVGTTTAFASSSASNYTWKGATGAANYQSTSADSAAWWWLRSPYPMYYSQALMVSNWGGCHQVNTCDSYGGVRPAVCVPL